MLCYVVLFFRFISPIGVASEVGEKENKRLQGVFVSNNVLNLSKRRLSEAEISLLSKGLKFIPTPRFIDKAALKRFGRKLRLKWFYRNEERAGTVQKEIEPIQEF